MALDALAKRFFPGIVLAMIALAAYLQASGVMQLVAAAYLAGDDATDAPALSKSPPPSVEPRAPKDAEPILARNPFDSVTGPLNKVESEVPDGGADPAKPALDLSNPLTAPDCGGIAVHAITESTDPEWS